MSRGNVVIPNSNLDVELPGGLPFVLQVVSGPVGLVVGISGADETKEVGRQIQQHARKAVTRAGDIEVVTVSRAGGELVEGGRLAPAVVEAVDVVEHKAPTE